MTTLAWPVFWICAGLLAYVYAGYPLLTALLARLFPRPARAAEIEPSVSFVILAYNEEADIAAKLENTLALDYPADRLEVVVASDGSTDRTDAIASSFADRGVRLFRADEHPGKTETTNRVVRETSGEVLVFSDATGLWEPGALRALVRGFADPDVGAVSGRVVYTYPAAASARGFRAYQHWIVFARRAESIWGTETSVSGSICAVRRALFTALPAHLDFDMAHPLHVAMAGLRTVYEADAISHESARSSARSEFDARVRMAMLAYGFLPYLVRSLPRVRRPVYVFAVLSHKVARWLAPLALVTLLISSAALATESAWIAALLAAQLAVYAAAWAGRREGATAGRLLGIPLFFVTLHLAFLRALVRVLRGERIGRWQPER